MPPANSGWVNRIRLPSIEELDQPVMVGGGGFADQLDGRRGQAGGGKQHVMGRGIKAADPGPDQLSQCARQYLIDALNEGAGQFDGIERVSANIC